MASKDQASSVKSSSQSEEKEKVPDSPTKRITRSQGSEPIASNPSPQSSKDKSSPSPVSTSPRSKSASTASRYATRSQESNEKEDPKESSPSSSASALVDDVNITPKQATDSQVDAAKDNVNKELPPTEDHPVSGEEVKKNLKDKTAAVGEKSETGTPVEGASSNIAIDHAYPRVSGKVSSRPTIQRKSSKDDHAYPLLSDSEWEYDEYDEDSEDDDEEVKSQESKEAENIFECRFCNEFFILSSLKKHIEEKHTHAETEICPRCGYCEKNGGPMKDHPSCYACWTCSMFFNSERVLTDHMLLHELPADGSKNYYFECKHCQARFASRRGLEQHRKVHDVGDNPNYIICNDENGNGSDEEVPIKECRLCKKFFKSDKSLHKHVKKVHTKVKTEICDRCGFFQEKGGAMGRHVCETPKDIKERMKQEKIRERHEDRIKKGKRYACKLCQKSYAYHQGLRAHRFTHLAAREKPFKCEVCPKVFSKKILFEDHKRIHSGEKPYLCHMCAKCFRSGANLRQHQRRCKNKVHSAPAPSSSNAPYGMPNAQPTMTPGVQGHFMCQLCTQVFGSMDQLQEHHRTTLCYPTGESSDFVPTDATSDFVGEILEGHQQPLVYEVQMEVQDGTGETVVINLGRVDKRERETDATKASNLMKKMIGTVESQYVRSEAPLASGESQSVRNEAPLALGENKSVTPVKAEHGEVIPVSIHKDSEVVKAVKEIASEKETGDAADDGGPEPMDDSDDDFNPPADCDDHDYTKENHSVLEEKQVKVKEQPKPKRLREVYFMCPKCKDLFPNKLACKHHMKAKHKKAKKFEGTVVLGASQDTRNKKGEDTLPVDWAYLCSHCKSHFPENEIEQHLETVQMDLKEGACKVCFRNHKDGAKSNEYCKLSRALKVFQCPYCNVKPSVLCDLKAHLTKKHGNHSYPCTLCEEKFTHKRGLSYHMNKHKREGEPPKVKKKKTFICEICSRIMHDAQQFRIHLLQHDNPRPFACKLCDKAYQYPNGLRVHMRGHTKNFPFLCEFCSRSFKTKACLICHIRCHTGDKPFNCTRCGKPFRTKANVRQHMKRCSVPTSTVGINASTGHERAELEVATEIVTEQPETYLLLVPHNK